MTIMSDLKIGDPIAGGYFAGIMNTRLIAGSLDSLEAMNYGLVLRLDEIESPEPLSWRLNPKVKNSNKCQSIWNGLAVTHSVPYSRNHPAFRHVQSYPHYAHHEGSSWYLPAIVELEIIYSSGLINKDYWSSSEGFALVSGERFMVKNLESKFYVRPVKTLLISTHLIALVDSNYED